MNGVGITASGAMTAKAPVRQVEAEINAIGWPINIRRRIGGAKKGSIHMRYFEIDTAVAAKKFGLPSTHRSLGRITVPCEQWCAFAERADASPDVLIMATRFLTEGSILTYLAYISTEVAEKWEDGAIA